MLNANRERLGDAAISDDEQDVEGEADDEEHIQLGKIGEDDEPGWVMGTISKTPKQHIDSFRWKHMRLDGLAQLGWWDMAYNFRKRDMKYGMAKLSVPAVVKPQTGMTAATPSPPTFGELLQTLVNVHRQLEMPQGTSRP